MNNNPKITFDHKDQLLNELRTWFKEKMNSDKDHRFANVYQILKGLALFLIGNLAYVNLLTISYSSIIFKISMCCIITFCSILLIFNVAHDAAHNAIFKSRFLNDLIKRLIFIPMGLDGYLWGIRHIRAHHPLTNIPGSDSDVAETKLLRLTPHTPWHPFHRYQQFYAPFLYMLVFPVGIWIKDIHRLNEKMIRSLIGFKASTLNTINFFIFKLLHIAFWFIIPMTIGNQSLALTFILYIIALFFASLLFISLAGLNHYSDEIDFPLPNQKGEMLIPWSHHQINVNVDWETKSLILTELFGGGNTHIAHHLLPNISGRHLFEVTQKIKELSLKYHVHYKEYSFFEAAKRHFRMLTIFGKNRSLHD